MSVDYLLHESGVGYAIFKVAIQADTIGNRLKEVQTASQDLAKFGKMIQLVSFAPFQGASQALENANDISEGIVSDYLQTVLETNLPNAGKKKKVTLGVSDKNLAGSIKAAFNYVECETGDTSEVVADLLRGLRQHAPKLLKQLQEGDIDRAQLGLGHAYSRAKVKFSVHKNDNHIIQAIATLDQLEKDVNNSAMRVREWYSWHFPELIKIVSENQQYTRVVLFIGDKKSLTDESLHALAAEVGDDESIAQSIIDAARVSMGREMSDEDMEHLKKFAHCSASLYTFRKNLHSYLISKMGVVAPNLAALIGEMVGARLIAKAGSLTNLAKYPASTVQILGAEKALFRALKTKGNTPKYGLIYHSSFIGKTPAKHRGRISRFLANKTSVASRIDNFSEAPTTKFGEALRKQVEDRITFYTSGTAPEKNMDVMKRTMDEVLAGMNIADPTGGAASDAEDAPGVTSQATHQVERQKADKAAKQEKREKKDKKKRESLGDAMDVDEVEATVGAEGVEEAVEVKKEKKSKKEKRKRADDEEPGEKKKKKRKSKSE